jgi:hypothetical protein
MRPDKRLVISTSTTSRSADRRPTGLTRDGARRIAENVAKLLERVPLRHDCAVRKSQWRATFAPWIFLRRIVMTAQNGFAP